MEKTSKAFLRVETHVQQVLRGYFTLEEEEVTSGTVSDVPVDQSSKDKIQELERQLSEMKVKMEQQ